MSNMGQAGHRGTDVRPEEIRIASAAAAEALTNLPTAVAGAWDALPEAARTLAGLQTAAALQQASAVSSALARRLANQADGQQAAVRDALRATVDGDSEVAAGLSAAPFRSLA